MRLTINAFCKKLYGCEHWNQCKFSCDTSYETKVQFSKPIGNFIGKNYQSGGVVIVGINMHYDEEPKYPKPFSFWKEIMYNDTKEFAWLHGGPFPNIVKAFKVIWPEFNDNIWDYVTFTNSIKCSHSLGRSEPTFIQQANCLMRKSWILEELQILKPNLVFTMGDIPMTPFLSEKGANNNFNNPLFPKYLKLNGMHIFQLPHLSNLITINRYNKKYIKSRSVPEAFNKYFDYLDIPQHERTPQNVKTRYFDSSFDSNLLLTVVLNSIKKKIKEVGFTL